MTTNSKPRPAPNIPKIPTSWLILIVFLGIIYSIFQPWAKSTLGLKLPSIPELISSQNSQPTQRPKSHTTDDTQDKATPEKPTSERTATNEKSKDQSPDPDSSQTAAKDDTATENEESPYDLLKKLNGDVYVSEAGVRYTRGSEEGHRIKHLARHMNDMPDRAGSHGVFEGGWKVTLERIDQAYLRSQQKDPKTKVRQEDNRSVIETEFNGPIGYVGGKEGAKKGHPATRRLRLVTEGDRFITAFPY